jgi:hypothetical protein
MDFFPVADSNGGAKLLIGDSREYMYDNAGASCAVQVTVQTDNDSSSSPRPTFLSKVLDQIRLVDRDRGVPVL